MWQAEVDNVRCMSASPATAVGQKALHRAKRRYRTVTCFTIQPSIRKLYLQSQGPCRFGTPEFGSFPAHKRPKKQQETQTQLIS